MLHLLRSLGANVFLSLLLPTGNEGSDVCRDTRAVPRWCAGTEVQGLPMPDQCGGCCRCREAAPRCVGICYPGVWSPLYWAASLSRFTCALSVVTREN